MTNQPINIDARFIADIEPDPAFIERMVRVIDEAITDHLSDFAWQIGTDYVPAPDELTDEFEDAMAEQVINPLMDRLTNFIIAKMITN